MNMHFSTSEKIDDLYQQQYLYKKELKHSTIVDRIQWLKQLRKAIQQQEEQIKSALHSDFRKNEIESEITEIFAVILEINSFIKNLKKWSKPKSVSSPLMFTNLRGKLIYEAKGNTLIITPWNYPFQLPFVHLIASIAAGNTILLKLSEFTPHTNSIIKEIVSKIFKAEHVAVIEGDADTTTHLLKHKFDHIHFTGSPQVGKIVMKAAANHLSSVTLELGGKSPAFIDSNINIEEVVNNIIWAKFVNMGQTCIAPDYLLVDRKIETQFETVLLAQLKNAFGENPIESNDLARIINERQFQRLKENIDEISPENGKWLIKGEINDQQLFIAPSVLKNPSLTTKIMTEEIFGPILPIIYYEQIDAALDIVNKQKKPLALYIFSNNNHFQKTVLDNTSAGGTTINDAMVHILHPKLPFSGVNNSGIGQSLGIFGFKSFSHERAVATAIVFPLSKFFWYPYSAKTRTILNLLKRLFT